MCDPVMIGITSTVMSAGSALMQGRAQQQAANANASIAEQNAEQARRQADEIQRQKAREITDLNWNKQKTLSAQRVAMAGAGIDASSGSGLDLLQSTAYQSTEDVNNLDWNAANKEWQVKAQAVDYENQASNSRAQGQNAMTQGIIGAATSVAMGAYNIMGGAGAAGSTAGKSSFGLVSDKWKLTNNIKPWQASRNAATYWKG